MPTMGRRFKPFLKDRCMNEKTASMPGMEEARFQDIAAAAKCDDPLSRAQAGLAATNRLATPDPAAA
jgi:hypothetical protein